MDSKEIGKLIKKLRMNKGLTQQELGDKVGVGFRAVSKWESGLTLPDISIISELSKILGVKSDYLLCPSAYYCHQPKKHSKKKYLSSLKINIVIKKKILKS